MFAQENFLNLKFPAVMGIMNVTPDSFSNDGLFNRTEEAIKYAVSLKKYGADIIDVGAESTRPGADVLDVEEEINRLKEVVSSLLQKNILISVDTYKEKTSIEMLKLGVRIINNVSGIFTEKLIEAVLRYSAKIIVMHSVTIPATKKCQLKEPEKIMDILLKFFHEKILELKNCGISEQQIIIDPGFGFGKNLAVNMEILEKLSLLKQFNVPILAALSRKRFVRKIAEKTEKTPDDTSADLSIMAIKNGADIVRIHNVELLKNKMEKM